MSYTPHPSLFRLCDIRGIYQQTLFEQDADHIGQSFTIHIKQQIHTPTIVIGYDGRLSSPALATALIKGIQKQGGHVINIGCCPSPTLYFAAHKLPNTHAGIIVTGSHNPPTHNGFKFVLNKRPFFGESLQNLRAPLPSQSSLKKSTHQKLNIKPDYIKALMTHITVRQPQRVIWDPGNGACGPILSELINFLPGHHTILNETVDGHFPAHHPDPSRPENLAQLKEAVLKNQADIGIAFDGDGDRLAAIDAKGRIWGSEYLLFLFTNQVLSENPHAPIITDAKVTETLIDTIKNKGGHVILSPTGHALIKERMKETQALFAGEHSGHMFFNDRYYGYDDAIYAALRLLEIADKKPLHEHIDSIPTFYKSNEISFPMQDKEQRKKLLASVQKDLTQQNIKISTIDGIKAFLPEGWILIRSSNTEDKLIGLIEAYQENQLSKLTKRLHQLLSPYLTK